LAFCAKCGRNLPEGSAFCPGCGAPSASPAGPPGSFPGPGPAGPGPTPPPQGYPGAMPPGGFPPSGQVPPGAFGAPPVPGAPGYGVPPYGVQSVGGMRKDLGQAYAQAAVFAGVLAGLGIVSLLFFRDFVGVLLAEGFALVVWFLAAQKIKQGRDLGNARTTVMIVAGICLAVGVLNVLFVNWLVGVIDMGASIPGFLCYNELKKA